MHGIFALLFGVMGGWIGLGTAVIQFDTQLVKSGPAIIQGVEQLKHCKCEMRVHGKMKTIIVRNRKCSNK